jgi:hypothetical protein
MKPVVVCGLGRFGLQVVEGLRNQGCAVTVLTDDTTSRERVDRAVAAGASLVRGDFLALAARRDAAIRDASAVVLTTASDVNNLEAALEIRGEAPGVRVVMRHSQPRLSRRFEADFGIAAALAPADLAAPAFVEAALSAPSSNERTRPAGRRARFPSQGRAIGGWERAGISPVRPGAASLTHSPSPSRQCRLAPRRGA